MYEIFTTVSVLNDGFIYASKLCRYPFSIVVYLQVTQPHTRNCLETSTYLKCNNFFYFLIGPSFGTRMLFQLNLIPFLVTYNSHLWTTVLKQDNDTLCLLHHNGEVNSYENEKTLGLWSPTEPEHLHLLQCNHMCS